MGEYLKLKRRENREKLLNNKRFFPVEIKKDQIKNDIPKENIVCVDRVINDKKESLITNEAWAKKVERLRLYEDEMIEYERKEQKGKAKKKKRAYYKEVRRLTKLVPKDQIKGYSKGLIYNHRRDGLMVTAYDKLVIDHKIPLIYGYKNKIPEKYMADKTNLQWLTVKDNMIKGTKPLIDNLNNWIIELVK